MPLRFTNNIVQSTNFFFSFTSSHKYLGLQHGLRCIGYRTSVYQSKTEVSEIENNLLCCLAKVFRLTNGRIGTNCPETQFHTSFIYWSPILWNTASRIYRTKLVENLTIVTHPSHELIWESETIGLLNYRYRALVCHPVSLNS